LAHRVSSFGVVRRHDGDPLDPEVVALQMIISFSFRLWAKCNEPVPLARARVGLENRSLQKENLRTSSSPLSPLPATCGPRRGAGVRCRTFSGRRRASGVEPSREEELRPPHLALACSRPRQMGRAAALRRPRLRGGSRSPRTARVCATSSDPTPGAGPRARAPSGPREGWRRRPRPRRTRRDDART